MTRVTKGSSKSILNYIFSTLFITKMIKINTYNRFFYVSDEVVQSTWSFWHFITQIVRKQSCSSIFCVCGQRMSINLFRRTLSKKLEINLIVVFIRSLLYSSSNLLPIRSSSHNKDAFEKLSMLPIFKQRQELCIRSRQVKKRIRLNSMWRHCVNFHTFYLVNVWIFRYS